MRSLVHAAAIAASVAGLAAATHVDTAHAVPAVSVHAVTVPAWMLRPCAAEDSVNCRWDAATRGNGRGHSFVVRQMPGSRTVCVFYVETSYAATHDACQVVR